MDITEVEQPRPERAAIGARLEADRRREALERPDQHRELEVGRGDPVGRDADAGAAASTGFFSQITALTRSMGTRRFSRPDRNPKWLPVDASISPRSTSPLGARSA